MMKDKIQNLY